MKILVTGAGGPAGISVIKILLERNYEVYAADMSPYSAGLFLVPTERRFVIPAGARIGFVNSIINLCQTHDIKLVIPTVDSELVPLAIHKTIFEAMNVKLATSNVATLQRTLDKWSLQHALVDCEHTAETQLLDDNFDVNAIAFPVIIKPRVGSGSRGVRILHSESELDEYPRNAKMIVQEYLPGDEFSVDVFCHEKKGLQGSPRKRVKIDGGIAVISQTVKRPELVDAAFEICETLGIDGAANVQFKLDKDGVPKLLEVNPRFPGGTSLTSTAGLDWVGATVRVAAGEAPMLDREIRELTMVRRYEEQYIEHGVIEDVPMAFQPFELGNLDSANWD